MWEKILMTKEKVEYKITYCVFPLSNNKKTYYITLKRLKTIKKKSVSFFFGFTLGLFISLSYPYIIS